MTRITMPGTLMQNRTRKAEICCWACLFQRATLLRRTVQRGLYREATFGAMTCLTLATMGNGELLTQRCRWVRHSSCWGVFTTVEEHMKNRSEHQRREP